jgi:hypothetical protein
VRDLDLMFSPPAWSRARAADDGVAAYIGDAVDPTRRFGCCRASAGVIGRHRFLSTNLGPEAPGLIARAVSPERGFAWRWLPETAPARQDQSAVPQVRRPSTVYGSPPPWGRCQPPDPDLRHRHAGFMSMTASWRSI